MAKWGEGDPRWIVEERPDATNVNNWHWTERNASSWSQDRLNDLFKDFTVESDKANIQIVEIEKCEGEASANNRKGKLIFFYEWDLVLKWKGHTSGCSDIMCEGKINIPNLSEENDISEVDITVTVKDSNEESEILKQILHTTGKEQIRSKLSNYVDSLRVEFSKGMILPKKDDSGKPDSITNLTSGFNKKINMTQLKDTTDKQNIGVKVDTTTIRLSQKFQCRGQEFYDAMTRIEMVTAFTRGHVKMDATKGGQFALFGGNITGEFEELVPGKKIVQKWRYKQWPSDHMSTVTMNIDEKGDHTEVNVIQTGVPSSEADVTRNNWDRYYWEAIKRAFGFGVTFFT